MITYNVTDSAGLAADQVTRTVTVVTDTTPPVITLNGQSSVTIPLATNYVDPGATASDIVDGDISDRIQIVNSVNTNVPGTYTITYNVTDSAGLAADQVTRTVIVNQFDPLVGTFFFKIRDRYLGAAHHMNGRPGSLTANAGGWQELTVVKKSDGLYTLMSYQGPVENRQYYYLSDNGDSINFNTQDINQSTSLSIFDVNEKYLFQRSDGKYITHYWLGETRTLDFKNKYAHTTLHNSYQKWGKTPV